MKNARSIGMEWAGNTFVKNKYTDSLLRVTSNSIRHGLNGNTSRLFTNARIGAVIGDIVQNAVPINALKNHKADISGTYAMAAYATDKNGREFVAIVTVEQRTGNVESVEAYDMLHAVSGRQNKSSQADTKSQSIRSIKATEISIADFLSVVKDTHQSILSRDVLSHFNEEKNENGSYFHDALFSEELSTLSELRKDNERLCGTKEAASEPRTEGARAPPEESNVNSSSGETFYSLYLSKEDVPDYLKSGNRKNKNRQMRFSNGEQITISTDSEFEDFVKRAISGADGSMVAYGKVEDALVRQVKEKSNSKMDIEDFYLELLGYDLYHAYAEHENAKGIYDLDMSVDDLIYALKRVNQSEVISADQYKDGRNSVVLAIPADEGIMILVEVVSKSAGTLRLKTGWKMSAKKFEQKYRSSTSAAGSKSSIATARENATSNAIISQSPKKSTGKIDLSEDLDLAYLSLAKAPEKNDAKLQEMVDEAAKKAGYSIKAYHGSPIKGITTFDPSKIGSTTDDGLFGHGFYFTTNKLTADGYAGADGKTMPVYIRADNAWWGLGRTIEEVAETLDVSEDILTKKRTNLGTIIAPLMNYSRVFSSHLQEKGYDSVIVQHGKSDYEIVVFDNKKIKSADPVTYDDNGNIIPLSERFNEKNEDIRFSEDLATISELRKDNDRLRKQVVRLKSEMKVTERPTARRDDVEKLSRRLIREYKSTLSANDIADSVQELANFIVRNGDGEHELTWNGLKKRAEEVAERIVRSAEVLNDEAWQEYKGLRDYLKMHKFTISTEEASSIADFRAFKRRNGKCFKADCGKTNGVDASIGSRECPRDKITAYAKKMTGSFVEYVYAVSKELGYEKDMETDRCCPPRDRDPGGGRIGRPEYVYKSFCRISHP